MQPPASVAAAAAAAVADDDAAQQNFQVIRKVHAVPMCRRPTQRVLKTLGQAMCILIILLGYDELRFIRSSSRTPLMTL